MCAPMHTLLTLFRGQIKVENDLSPNPTLQITGVHQNIKVFEKSGVKELPPPSVQALRLFHILYFLIMSFVLLFVVQHRNRLFFFN